MFPAGVVLFGLLGASLAVTHHSSARTGALAVFVHLLWVLFCRPAGGERCRSREQQQQRHYCVLCCALISEFHIHEYCHAFLGEAGSANSK